MLWGDLPAPMAQHLDDGGRQQLAGQLQMALPYAAAADDQDAFNLHRSV
jgi:hypothetical protein